MISRPQGASGAIAEGECGGTIIATQGGEALAVRRVG